MRTPSKFDLYERSVQSPEAHIELVAQIASELRPGRALRDLREDFCGTFLLSCQWVRTHPQNTALGLDLDAATLAYGKKTHWSRLTPSERRRVSVRRQDVMTVTRPGADIVLAGNFSFYIFKQREVLKRYFERVRRSLRPGGLLILEMGGGPGMISKMKEWKHIRLPSGKRFTYIWDQISFDAITHDVRYAIHFQVGGRRIENAFEYDWRLWTIPEVRDLLREAGFKDSAVYWETEDEDGHGTGEYERREKGDNALAWIAQVVGIV